MYKARSMLPEASADNQPSEPHKFGGLWQSLTAGFLLLVLLAAACSKSASMALSDAMPRAGDLLSWTPTGVVETFDSENLYDLVDGQADSFFAYGFEQVAVQRYENAAAACLDVEISRMATPGDAYGLFSASISGSAANMGIDGDTDPGRRLAFWQNRYYVRVRAQQALPDADLWEIAQAVSKALPTGSPGDRPSLLDRLATDGLVERGVIFFHQEISIQDHLWLGGENLLGLGPETDGVLAPYIVDGRRAQLLLIQYPNAEDAAAGLAALQRREIDNLVLASARNRFLGAVFGELDQESAISLLNRALEDR